MNHHRNWIHRHRLGAFLVLAFGLSWWPWPLALVEPDSVPMVSFGPLLAAVLVTALAQGRDALWALARSIIRWRAPWSTWAFAALGPFGLAVLTGAAAYALGIIESVDTYQSGGWSTLLNVVVLMITTALLGGPLFEEVGWRGFFQPELQRRHSAVRASMVVGTVWVIWHLPLLVTDPTGQRPPLPFTAWILAQAVLIAWVYNTSRGSVLIAVVFHTAANTAGRMLLEPLVGEPGFSLVWWLMAALYLLAAVVLIWRTGGRLGITRLGRPDTIVTNSKERTVTSTRPESRSRFIGVGLE
ncbi:MAG: CPBP family intramembrane glutamic endopeptidase [Microbacteriaceae bacterium]